MPSPTDSTKSERDLEKLPTDPKRVKAFAAFFKNYMSVSSVVVAALPIPATALGAIETFANDRRMLSVFTSLFCFLTLGFIFYQRHALARWMFPEFTVEVVNRPRDQGEADVQLLVRWLKRSIMTLMPLLLILLAALFVSLYLDKIESGILEVIHASPSQLSSREAVLSSLVLSNVESSLAARKYYVGMFVCAEAAFILMATKEYLQDLLGLTDVEVMLGRKFGAPTKESEA